jgi:hypothetical protein
VKPATKPLIRELVSWAFQTVKYTLMTAYLDQRRAPPSERLDFTQPSETIMREMAAQAREIVAASNPTLPTDNVLIGLVLDWSAERLGYAKSQPWWRTLSLARKRQTDRPLIVLPQGGPGVDPGDAAIMLEWSCATIRNCGNVSSCERLHRFPTCEELQKSVSHAQSIAEHFWHVAIERCQQTPGRAAFDACFIPLVLDWCMTHRGFVR